MPMTADEALRKTRGHARWELIRGEVVYMDWSGAEHGAVTANVALELGAYVREHHLGRAYGAETGFLIESDPDTVRAPDAAFVRADRVAAAGRVAGAFPGPPDFAVEVVSPSDTFTKVEQKALQWLEAGASGVLLLDPRRRTATVYRDRDDVRTVCGDVDLDLSDLVPGWRPSLPVFFE